MNDVASLGFKIDARQLQAATKELRSLEQMGQRAGAMADILSGKVSSASRNVSELERSATRTQRALGSMFGLSIAGSLSTFLYGLARAKDQILELAKVAEDNRLRPELVSGLFGAARGAGATEAEITRALQQFSSVSKQSTDDAETFYKALSNISPALSRSFQNAGSQEERLRLVSEALRTTTDEVKRLQLAQEAFGTDSERVLRVLGAGREAISEYERNARALGMAVDQNMIQKARQADQVLNQLSNVVQSNLRAALVELAPIIANFAGQLGSMADAASRVISAIAGAQYATRNVLMERRTSLSAQVQQEQGEIDRLRAQAGGTFVEGTGTARDAIAAERRRMAAASQLRDVETELGARGEYADPRDRRRQASERFAATGGLNPNPPAFQPRPSLSSSGSNNEAEDSFTRAKRALEERNALAQKELDTLGMGTRAREEALAYERALNTAKRDGETLSADQLRQLRERAATYGQIQEAIERANDAQRKANELTDASRDAMKGILLAPTTKNPIDSLISSLDRFRQKLLDMAAEDLLDLMFGRRGKNGATTGGLFGGKGASGILGELLGLFGFMPAMADGGRLSGPGSGRSDSMLARVSNGEFIVNEKATSRHLALLEAINGNRLPAFADGGLNGMATVRAPASPSFGGSPFGNLIVNNMGQPVSAKARRDEQGNTVIDLEAVQESVSGRMASDITRGRGPVGPAMTARFGVTGNANLIG